MAASPTTNIGGLASGLDTNTIITQLLAIERQPQARLLQKQDIEEARQQALRDIKTRLQNLQTAATGLRDVGTWGDVQTVESSAPTKVAVTRTGGAAPGGYTVSVAALARAHQMTQSTALTSAAADDVLHLSLGGGAPVDVAVKAGDTLQTIADTLNSTTGVKAYATVVAGKLVLSGKDTGAANTISLTSDGTLAADLGMATTQTAQNADFTVGTTRYTDRASNTVTDVMPGVTLTLKGATTESADITVSAPAADTDAVKSKVQAFVDQYNSTIEFIRSKLTEKKVPNATTGADRVKGALRGDPALTSLLSGMRAAVSDTVAGAAAGADQLALVGISTGAASTGGVNQDAIAGKLTLDTEKLTDMLSTRFADVKRLFANVTGAYESEGLGQRMERLLAAQTKSGEGAVDLRISAEQKLIDAMTKRSAEFEVRLAAREKALRAQFTAMESALSRAQSQGSYLSAQLASLAGPSA